jgi:hypothetical protein
MARTFIAFDSASGCREVIIEVHPELDQVSNNEIEKLELRMYDRRIHLSMLITPKLTYFVQDKFKTLEFSPTSYDAKNLDTQVLFRQTNHGHVIHGEGLYTQVELWLDAVSGSWSSFIPDEALPFMLPEMVGALASSNFEKWDRLLEEGD